MRQGFHVCLYKRERNPIIPVFVQNDEAEICMSLDDFKSEVIRELGPIRWIFSNATFADMLDKAFNSVVLDIKKGAAVIVE